MHATFPLFDALAADAAAETGIRQARVNKNLLLDEAKRIARELGQEKRFVTADDVIRRYAFRHPREPLGNAAGSIFRDACWRFTGQTVKCTRVSGHGRLIRVWEFLGNVE